MINDTEQFYIYEGSLIVILIRGLKVVGQRASGQIHNIHKDTHGVVSQSATGSGRFYYLNGITVNVL